MAKNKYGITDSEFRVMGLLSQGLKRKEIALLMGVKPKAIDTFINKVVKKSGSTNTMHAFVRFERGELNE